MKFFFILILLLWMSHDKYINGQNMISHRVMKKLNSECFPENSCLHRSFKDSMASTACSCDRSCSQLGTCCKDSLYVDIPSPAIRPRCKTVHSPFSSAYFMIDRCLDGGNISHEWHSLCSDDWNGEDIILKLAPVTSLSTSITYKNYFCFKCHEMGDDVLYWNVRLLTESDMSNISNRSDFDMGVEFDTEIVPDKSTGIKLEYSRETKTWMAAVGKDNNTMSVVLEINIPEEIRSLPIECDPDVISSCCTTWSDTNVRDKCNSYTAVIYIAKESRFLKYKNAYCALCNFESLEDMYCRNSSADILGPAAGGYGVRSQENSSTGSEIYRGNGYYMQNVGGYGSSGSYSARGGGYEPSSGTYVTRGVPGEGWYGPKGSVNKRGGDEVNRGYAEAISGGYRGGVSKIYDGKSEVVSRGGYGGGTSGGGGSGAYGRGTGPVYAGEENREYGGGAGSRHRGGYIQGDRAGYGGAAGGVRVEGDSTRYGGGYERGGITEYGGGSAGYTAANGEGYGGGSSAGYGGGSDRSGTAGHGVVSSGGYGARAGVGYGGYDRGGSAGYRVANREGYGAGVGARYGGGYERGGSSGYGVANSEGYGAGAGARYGGGYERGGSVGYGVANSGGYGDGSRYGGAYERGGNAGYGGTISGDYGGVYERRGSAEYGGMSSGGYGGGGGDLFHYGGGGGAGYGVGYSEGYSGISGGGYGGVARTEYGRGYVRRSSAGLRGGTNTRNRQETARRKKLFSFVDMLRVNKEKNSRRQKCDKNFLWDPYSRTCLELICDNPVLELKEGQCV